MYRYQTHQGVPFHTELCPVQGFNILPLNYCFSPGVIFLMTPGSTSKEHQSAARFLYEYSAPIAIELHMSYIMHVEGQYNSSYKSLGLSG